MKWHEGRVRTVSRATPNFSKYSFSECLSHWCKSEWEIGLMAPLL